MLRTIKIFWLVAVLSFGVSLVHSQDEVITNQDIIALTAVRLNKSLIIQKIGLTKARFDLSTKGLIALKRAGVADEVVEAMFAAHKNAVAPAVGEAPGPSSPPEAAVAGAQPPTEAPIVTTARSEA